MNRFLYTFLLYCFQPLVLLRLGIRSIRSPQYRHRIKERYGLASLPLRGGIWIHSVSVGETIAAIPLVKALQQDYPHLPITITTMTPTGSEQVKRHFADSVQHCYLPYDLPCAMSRLINRMEPKLAIIMETELWPNMIHQLHRKRIPVLLANARLSERSQRGYQKVARLTRSLLSELSAVAAQNYTDGQRFIQLGLEANKLHVTGSIKFDIQASDSAIQQGQALKSLWKSDRPVWVAASTHQGEDELLLKAHQHFLTHAPDALLILVPRHPERFDRVAVLVEQTGLSMQRKTQLGKFNNATQVLLGDTMGELMSLFSAADFAFIGGSLVEHGGHNPLEAAAFGLPIMMGPSHFNFATIAEKLTDGGAMITVNSPAELAQQLIEWQKDRSSAQTMGKNALQVLQHNQGALTRHIALIKPLLGDHSL
ncbi:3-deoxy-D-manno-octulosonic acid transferase [Vibrio metoecus]|uniref:lipid IV(A) 3-deoxy-D-manno-octulosonic acid transferase n=1 Tax=Vibrio metoecus TaxID=1481663 RepID=UPI0006D79007|nr:lipid IV(A) 3-deoxy-D-manno-octulosonic acid transferase [Vibrio metoecus]KQB03540.1 3-deoxy-D-manno-octulosonic acid transferase [Vibrio metoecus]PAR48991.1 3-deoxy-D-manno-octulosonic acid transferase [Vibrio metoecus]